MPPEQTDPGRYRLHARPQKRVITPLFPNESYRVFVQFPRIFKTNVALPIILTRSADLGAFIFPRLEYKAKQASLIIS